MESWRLLPGELNKYILFLVRLSYFYLKPFLIHVRQIIVTDILKYDTIVQRQKKMDSRSTGEQLTNFISSVSASIKIDEFSFIF